MFRIIYYVWYTNIKFLDTPEYNNNTKYEIYNINYNILFGFRR